MLRFTSRKDAKKRAKEVLGMLKTKDWEVEIRKLDSSTVSPLFGYLLIRESLSIVEVSSYGDSFNVRRSDGLFLPWADCGRQYADPNEALADQLKLAKEYRKVIDGYIQSAKRGGHARN